MTAPTAAPRQRPDTTGGTVHIARWILALVAVAFTVAVVTVRKLVADAVTAAPAGGGRVLRSHRDLLMTAGSR